MNETKKEQLSAFMDDEIDGLQKDQVEQILKDPELLDTWSRYHLVSDCLKRNLPEHLDRELAGKISKSIHQEPAIVAPGGLSRSFVKPAAGFAIAASVAALAIFGIQQQQPGGPHEIPQPPLVQSIPGGGGNGSVYAPVRQVSTGSGNITSECNGNPGENSRPAPDNGQQADRNEAQEAQSGVNCP